MHIVLKFYQIYSDNNITITTKYSQEVVSQFLKYSTYLSNYIYLNYHKLTPLLIHLLLLTFHITQDLDISVLYVLYIHCLVKNWIIVFFKTESAVYHPRSRFYTATKSFLWPEKCASLLAQMPQSNSTIPRFGLVVLLIIIFLMKLRSFTRLPCKDIFIFFSKENAYLNNL